MNIQTLLRPILDEVPTGKRYRPIKSWARAEYLVVPNDIGLEPYCVTNEGERVKCYWSRSNIEYYLVRGTIVEMM